MKPEKSLAGDERRQAAVVIMCWIVGHGQSSRSSGRGVFLGRRVPREACSLVESVRDSNTPADEGFGGKGETGFGCLRRASQRTAGSVRLGQGGCVLDMRRWPGWEALEDPCRWTPIVGYRWPSGLDDAERISQGGWEQGMEWKTERASSKLAATQTEFDELCAVMRMPFGAETRRINRTARDGRIIGPG